LSLQISLTNDKDKPMHFESGAVVIHPGERIVVSGIYVGELWSGLPDSAFPLVNEINRGPPNFLSLFDLAERNSTRKTVKLRNSTRTQTHSPL
jgi:hypothetical protein